MGFPLNGLWLILLVVLPALSRPVSLRPVPNSRKGFDKQYKSLFKAYEKGNEQEPTEQIRTFAIPEHWFTEVFGPDRGVEVRQKVPRAVQGF